MAPMNCAKTKCLTLNTRLRYAEFICRRGIACLAKGAILSTSTHSAQDRKLEIQGGRCSEQRYGLSLVYSVYWNLPELLLILFFYYSLRQFNVWIHKKWKINCYFYYKIKTAGSNIFLILYIHPLVFLSFSCLLLLFLFLSQLNSHLSNGFFNLLVNYFPILFCLLVLL